MKKNLYQEIVNKGINNWHDLINFLDGKKVKFTDDKSKGSYPSRFTLNFKSNYDSVRRLTSITTFQETTILTNVCAGKTYTSLYFRDLMFVGDSLDSLKEELKELEENFFKRKEELNSKIELLEKFELDEYNEIMLKAYKIYKNLNLSGKEDFTKVYKSLL